MKPLVILCLAFCLLSTVVSRAMPEGEEEEGAEEGADDASEGGEEETEDDAGGDEGGSEDGGDDAGGDDDAGGSGGGGKNDPANTYKQVVALLDKDTKVDNIQSEYLRSALNNDLQAKLRNPVVEAIGKVGDYSKIQGCFQSMGGDVQKVVSEEEKTFKDCVEQKKSEYQCSEDSSKTAKDKFGEITSKITSCVSSKGH